MQEKRAAVRNPVQQSLLPAKESKQILSVCSKHNNSLTDFLSDLSGMRKQPFHGTHHVTLFYILEKKSTCPEVEAFVLFIESFCPFRGLGGEKGGADSGMWFAFLCKKE